MAARYNGGNRVLKQGGFLGLLRWLVLCWIKSFACMVGMHLIFYNVWIMRLYMEEYEGACRFQHTYKTELLSTSCVEGFSFFAIALVGSGGPNCRPKSLFQCIPGACETSKYFHKKWIISHFSPIKTWENLLFVEVFWCFTYASKECTERLLGLQLGQSLTPRSNYRNCKSHHSFR